MWKTFFILSVVAVFLGVVRPSQAQTNTVNPWQTTGNGTAILDNYGTYPGIDIFYKGKNGWGSAPIVDQMQVWAFGFSDLHGVSYSPVSNASVGIAGDLLPDSLYTNAVTLHEFKLGTWNFGSPARDVEVQIWNWDYTTLFTNATMNVGATYSLFSATNITSFGGLHIQFSSLGQVAIDDIQISTTPVLIPEPSTLVLTAAGLGLLAGIVRRRRNKSAA